MSFIRPARPPQWFAELFTVVSVTYESIILEFSEFPTRPPTLLAAPETSIDEKHSSIELLAIRLPQIPPMFMLPEAEPSAEAHLLIRLFEALPTIPPTSALEAFITP